VDYRGLSSARAVFNPAWAPHARLHEVWQLGTNTALGVFSLWLVWFRHELRLPIFVTGDFLLSYGLRASYGGSIVLSDSTEKMILGVNLGLFAYTLAILMAAVAVIMDSRSRPAGAAARHGRNLSKSG
jgi:hypothetical protein